MLTESCEIVNSKNATALKEPSANSALPGCDQDEKAEAQSKHEVSKVMARWHCCVCTSSTVLSKGKLKR